MVKLFSNIKNIVAKPREKKPGTAVALHLGGGQTTSPVKAGEEQVAKLVVMGKGSAFSAEIVDYALEMAQRMNYEIIALNTAPLSCETFRLFSSSRNNICREFQDHSFENAAFFQARAEEKGIHFVHRVKFVDTDTALEEVREEFGDNIGFIVSEPEADQVVAAHAREERRPEAGIFVYAMT